MFSRGFRATQTTLHTCAFLLIVSSANLSRRIHVAVLCKFSKCDREINLEEGERHEVYSSVVTLVSPTTSLPRWAAKRFAYAALRIFYRAQSFRKKITCAFCIRESFQEVHEIQDSYDAVRVILKKFLSAWKTQPNP
jgi:hypothetical protein